MERYLPTNDLLFKKMLATPGHENIAKHLISDCFGPGLRIKSLVAIDPYSVEAVTRAVADGQVGETALAKTLRDVTYAVELESPSGSTVTVTVEMQALANDRFIPRSLYYLATAYTKRYGISGEDPYQSLRPVWALNILGTRLFDDATCFRIEEFPPHNFAPGADTWQWRLAFLELAKVAANPLLEGWINLLRTGRARPGDPEYLQEAAQVVEYSNLNPEEIKMVDLIEKWRADQVTQQGYYRRLAERAEELNRETEKLNRETEKLNRETEELRRQAEKTTEYAKKLGLLEGARRLLAAGQDPTWVAETMGIDVAEVNALKNP